MLSKPYSEQTAQRIDHEVDVLIAECYALARKILEENREGLHKLAELLLEREVIYTEDLERIFGKRQAGARNPLESVHPEGDGAAAGDESERGDRVASLPDAVEETRQTTDNDTAEV